MGPGVPGRVRLRLHNELMLRRAPHLRRGRLPATWLIVAATSLAATHGCGPDGASAGSDARQDTRPGETSSFVDAAGVHHPVDEPGGRIVSLVPSATTTMHVIGAGDLLVGRTDYDTAPWLADLPSVGGGLEPNLEVLLSLRPDLVIRFEGEQDPRTPARLDELGIRHVAVRPSSLADIYLTTEIVGYATGHTEAADSLARAIRAELEEVARSVAPLPRLRVLYSLGGAPPWVSGPGTFVADIIGLAGGDNVFDDLTSPWAAVSPEEVRRRDIDVVLVPQASSFDPALAPGARIVEVGALLDIPGPDVPAAARRVAELLHGRTSG